MTSNTLITLARKDGEFNIDSFIGYYQDRGAFTPDQLSMLLWRLDEHDIPRDGVPFKVIIKRNREREQLRSMPGWKLRKLWPYLSEHQRAVCREGH